MLSPAFLSSIYWEERWLDLVAEGEVDLPAYAGSTIRGALGTVMQPELCAMARPCEGDCQRPGECRFYSLFEQSRAHQGKGSNIPKPMILEPPGGEGLRAMAICGGGGGASSHSPALHNARAPVPDGSLLRMGLRGLGAAGAALDGVVEGVRRQGLDVKGGRLRLARVEGGRRCLDGAATAAPPAASEGDSGAVRLAVTTPVLIRDSVAGGGEVCLDPVRLGTLLLDQAAIRAVTVFNTFFARGAGERIPFVRPEWPGVTLAAHRMFRYRIPRHSYRQDRWMDFDGLAGWLQWQGQTAQLLPWLRAAEVLHVGQKATFGLGRVELVEITPPTTR